MPMDEIFVRVFSAVLYVGFVDRHLLPANSRSTKPGFAAIGYCFRLISLAPHSCEEMTVKVIEGQAVSTVVPEQNR
jgi:hypothetical protein